MDQVLVVAPAHARAMDRAVVIIQVPVMDLARESTHVWQLEVATYLVRALHPIRVRSNNNLIGIC